MGVAGTVRGSFFEAPLWVDQKRAPGTTAQTALPWSTLLRSTLSGQALLLSPNLVWFSIALLVYLLFPYDMEGARTLRGAFVALPLLGAPSSSSESSSSSSSSYSSESESDSESESLPACASPGRKSSSPPLLSPSSLSLSLSLSLSRCRFRDGWGCATVWARTTFLRCDEEAAAEEEAILPSS